MDIQSFLIGPYPLNLQTIDKLFLYDALVALLVAIVLVLVLRFYSLNRVNFDLTRRFKNLLFSYSLFVLIWVWFRYENAPFLNWRLWVILWAVIILGWLIKIFIYIGKDYKKDLEKVAREKVREKYKK